MRRSRKGKRYRFNAEPILHLSRTYAEKTMKDFINFEIIAKLDGQRVKYDMRHKKRPDLRLQFETDATVKAEHIPALVYGLFCKWAYKYNKSTRARLTAKQKEVYDMIVWFWNEENRAPTYDEIREMRGLSSKGSIFHVVRLLIDRGWCWKDEDGKIIPMDIAAPEAVI